MKLIKVNYLLLLMLLVFNTFYSQQEDNFNIIGTDRKNLLKSAFQEHERIYTGNYDEVAYAVDDTTAYWFYFDENDNCKMFSIKKNKEFYDDAVLMLGIVFPNKEIKRDLYFFWNSRMMAVIFKETDHISIVYQKVSPQLLKQ